jgi:hypothetical protein
MQSTTMLFLIMQQLGMSLAGLATIFGFLGIAAGVGGMDKWKDIQDAVGAAQQEVVKKFCANIEKEIAATKADAKKKAEEWAKTEGKQDDEEAKAVKMEEFLAYVNGLDGQVRWDLLQLWMEHGRRGALATITIPELDTTLLLEGLVG